MEDSPRLLEDDNIQENDTPYRSYRRRRYRYDDDDSYRESDIKEDLLLNDPALNKKRWQNRRRMAWASLLSMTIVTYLLIFTKIVPEHRIKILSEVIIWYYFCSASVIGAYMGFTTWASRK